MFVPIKFRARGNAAAEGPLAVVNVETFGQTIGTLEVFAQFMVAVTETLSFAKKLLVGLNVIVLVPPPVKTPPPEMVRVPERRLQILMDAFVAVAAFIAWLNVSVTFVFTAELTVLRTGLVAVKVG